MSSSIKLRAHDPLDMEVIAAWLQDALVPLADVAYLKRDKRFVLVANRFKWESAPPGTPPNLQEAAPASDARFEDEAGEPAFQRVNCGVCFDRVRAVRTRGLDLKNKDHILNLLTIDAAPDAVTLLFSGDAAIRLEVAAIACHVEDLGEPWPTRWQPAHGEAEPAEREKAGHEG
ncbi:MAG: DUF2948 family protein [Rhodospirillales bacterium]|nr:DUF2948 family protein [Rhodospirillales bacterium]MDH3911856.1 DUF2948 family protein [Rhodospirillales bacterium]MDH3969044.1 DUF2948 family protein [Rhodospirillales bacterium]